MKSIYTLILVVLVGGSLSAQTTHTITNSGFTYSPDSLAANVGDQITFNMDFTQHPLHEVSSTTWAADGSTQLAGGFSATTGSTFSVTMSAAGTRYYVCSNHVSLGMKGRIFVTAPNGIQSIGAVAASAFPNPASNQLHVIVGTASDTHCTLINMLGQTVLQKDAMPTAGVVTLDLSAISDGTYVLSTLSEGVTHTSRVQVAH